MPKLSTADAPAKLRPYMFHGIDLRWEGSAEAVGTCPFCDKPNHFYVNQETGQWQCKVCGGPSKNGGGNVYNFLREVHKLSLSSTPIEALEEVAEERRLPLATLERWELVRSFIDNQWLLPGYGTKGITNLYRWSNIAGKRRLIVTATMDHCLLGSQFWDDKKPDADVCEGPWDAMGLECAYRCFALAGSKVARSGDRAKVIYATANVVAAPGCEVFKEDWAKKFKGKNVRLWYDSDHPRRHPTGHKQAGEVRMVRGKPDVPGYLGMERVAKLLYPVAKSIHIIDWGGGGYDTALPDGFDIRDFLTTNHAITATTSVKSAPSSTGGVV